ncbi:hypothetical protein Pelo_19159 [Pelomyxa schiedti]|nr:hypothetical protein Pelo_19159 [Pelomyxa schiedti]
MRQAGTTALTLGKRLINYKKLNIKNKHKQMVRRSLEGDDQSMVCPGVWSELSTLLSQAQQYIMDAQLPS